MIKALPIRGVDKAAAEPASPSKNNAASAGFLCLRCPEKSLIEPNLLIPLDLLIPEIRVITRPCMVTKR